MIGALRGRSVVALTAGMCLIFAACSGGEQASSSSQTQDSGSSATDTTAAVDQSTQQAWQQIDDRLSEMAPEVSLLAARITSGGTCDPIHALEPATVLPIASQFKLFVLGAVAEQIAAGQLAWNQPVSIEEADKSFGGAADSLEYLEPGTEVEIQEAATKMISISDNTATDMLMRLVGRQAVEDVVFEWMNDATANFPFLTTRQMFILKYADGAAEQYLQTPQDERAEFLASSVDTRPVSDIASGLTLEPRYVETLEWFATSEDLCRAFAALQELSTYPSMAPLSTVLSQEVAGIDLDESDWPTVWYKGGSEPGVLTLGWLAVSSEGDTYVVEAMLMDSEAALPEDSINELVDLARDAFALLA